MLKFYYIYNYLAKFNINIFNQKNINKFFFY